MPYEMPSAGTDRLFSSEYCRMQPCRYCRACFRCLAGRYQRRARFAQSAFFAYCYRRRRRALTLAPLFRYDDRGAMVPELAMRVPTLANHDISADGRRITLHLRRRLSWSDGEPLNASDIVFTWHAVMNSANNTKLRAGWDLITAIATPDDATAIVTLRKPDATILSIFAGGGDAAYPPLPAHLFAGAPNLIMSRSMPHPSRAGLGYSRPGSMAARCHSSRIPAIGEERRRLPRSSSLCIRRLER